MITIKQIALQIGVRQSTLRHFCTDFKIDIARYYPSSSRLCGDTILDNEFINFLRKNQVFIKSFEFDYYNNKTPEEIAIKINRAVNEVHAILIKYIPKWYISGTYKPPADYRYPLRYFSSYGIDFDLGGDYTFLNTDNVKVNEEIKTDTDEDKSDEIIDTSLNLIGYKDIYQNILLQLEPILNPSDISEWGLNNPGGIILFGPPGCGKTYWAFNISKMIAYDFKEIPRSIFGSTYIDGAMINLKNKIEEFSINPKTLIFFDEFDSVAGQRNQGNSSSTENSKVVNTLLQEIPKLIEKRILIVAATNFLDSIDPAVIRPGRFDLKIPIFPPTPDERILLTCYNLLNDLSPNSILRNILEWNKADKYEFWLNYTNHMNLFSNSLIVDFTQVLKKRLKSIYQETKSFQIAINNNLLLTVIEETSAKITSKDVECYSQFYNEVKKLGGNIYAMRLELLFAELNIYYGKNKKDAPRPIGFRNPKYES